MKNILISMKQLLNKAKNNQRGEMSDSVMIIIGMLLFVFAVVGITVYSLASQTDKLAQEVYDAKTSEALSNIITAKDVKLSDVEKLQQELDATGITADITIAIGHLDNNVGKKAAVTTENMEGENQMYWTYLSVEDFKSSDIKLNKGDQVIITVKSTSKSFGHTMRKFIFNIVGKENGEIQAIAQGLVP